MSGQTVLRTLALAMLIGLATLLWSRTVTQAQSVTAIQIDRVAMAGFPEVVAGVTVIADGKPMGGLTAADFQVTEDGASVGTVEATDDGSGAVAVAIAIDASGSVGESNLARIKTEAARLVDSLSPGDEVALVSFSDWTDPLLRLTSDRDAAKAAVGGVGAGTNTAFYNGLYTAVDALASSTAPGRAVVVFSDGEEFGGISSKTEDDVLLRALDLGVQVYTVDTGTATVGQAQIFLDPAHTGGRYFPSLDDSVVTAVLEDLDSELRHQYVLTYEHDIAVAGNPTLEISVGSRGVSAVGARELCADTTSPIVSLPAIVSGATVSGEREVAPAILCAGSEAASAEYFLDGESVYSVNEPPFQYQMLSDKLSRGGHTLSAQVTFADGSVTESPVTAFKLSGTRFVNPAYLLLVLGGAIVVGFILLVIVRRGRRPARATLGDATVVTPGLGAAVRKGAPQVAVEWSGRDSLVVVEGPTRGQRYALGAKPVIMGRAPHCDIVLSGASVSREHARISQKGDTYVIRDLESTNGTRVNGQRVDQANLASGDRIEVSPYILELSVEPSKQGTANGDAE